MTNLSWPTIRRRALLKCKAARTEVALGLAKESDLYKNSSTILKVFIGYAEQLAGMIGAILDSVVSQVASNCPGEAETFKEEVPRMVRTTIRQLGGQGEDAKAVPLRVAEIAGAEWDDAKRPDIENRWRKAEDALVEMLTARTFLALEETLDAAKEVKKTEAKEARGQVVDPRDDPKMLSLTEASMAFNLPKSTLSNAAKKHHGELGYLRHVKRGRFIYFWRKDVEGLARSRVGIRGRPVS